MKKILCVILVVMVLTMGVSVSAVNTGIEKLSELSDDECIKFLKDNGVAIPEIYEDELDCVPFVRLIIEQVEEDNNTEFAFGYTVLLEFAYEIKTAVNEYYSNGDIMTIAYESSTSNILQDNIVYGSWQSEYEFYNCYAYAIGLDEAFNPGQIEWVNLGNAKADYLYDWTEDILTIAGWVYDDLVSLGYAVENPTTSMPTTLVDIHTNLVCIRKDNDGYGGINDYHVMRKGTDGNWYHKPGKTNPLKYKVVPSYEHIWVSEGYNGKDYTYFRISDFTYDSTIYFIKYTTPHKYVYKSCGSNQHISTCTICGETSDSATACIYINYICKFCGHDNRYDQIVSVPGDAELLYE